MLRAAAYIRVSTDEQTEFSPDAQLKAIQKYCNDNDFALDREHIYIDEGISGRKAEKRPAFQEMIKHAKKKEFDVILVHKFDRFARSREDSVVYKSLLKKECNVRVISITESIEDDKFSVILEAMLEAMAEYYSLNLADEVKKGMTEKAMRGGYQTYAPFGYTMKDKKLVIKEDEAKAVKTIFNEFIKGTGYLPIAKMINEMGFKTRFGNKFENRTIEYILRNPAYKGYARWTPTGRVRRNFSNEDTIIVKSEHEPIIPEETFDQVQELVAKRKTIHRKYFKGINPANLHWLNGLVRCSTCGKTLVRNTKIYYQCNGYSKGTCLTSQTVKITDIEKAILEQLKKDMTEGLNLQKRSKIISTDNTDTFIAQLNKLPEKEARAKEAYINGIDSLEEYKQNKINIENQRKMLEAQIKSSKKEVYNPKTLQKQIKKLYEILTDEKISMKQKHEVSHLVIDKIVFDKSAQTLHLTYLYQM